MSMVSILVYVLILFSETTTAHPRDIPVANHKAIHGLCVDPTSPQRLATYTEVGVGVWVLVWVGGCGLVEEWVWSCDPFNLSLYFRELFSSGMWDIFQNLYPLAICVQCMCVCEFVVCFVLPYYCTWVMGNLIHTTVKPTTTVKQLRL